MDFQSDKIELAKRLLDTEDAHIIDAVKSIFKKLDTEDQWGDLPEKVAANAEESLRQIDAGLGIPHDQAREMYQSTIG